VTATPGEVKLFFCLVLTFLNCSFGVEEVKLVKFVLVVGRCGNSNFVVAKVALLVIAASLVLLFEVM
jgi:hypothetical protein